MPSPPVLLPDRQPSTPRWLRWTVVGILTLLLHMSVFEWAQHQLGPALHPAPATMEAQLHPAPAKPPPPPKPAPPKQSRPKPPSKPAAPPPATPAPAQTIADGPAVTGSPATNTEPASETAASKEEKTVETGTRYRIDPPPSAELKYEVEALREGQTVYGHGKITWNTGNGAYAINGEAGVLFFTVLNFGSRGTIDDYGIAPARYSETPFRKSEVATHFTRERNTISFSASTVSYPIRGGEQDRASIIWQLAGIGRGDREKFATNAQFPVFVAGVRDGETWDIRVIGEENITTGIGPLQAWHLVRVPRPGSYDKKLDIWLAPEREWYPVRLRYTDVNGDYLDMAVSSITPPPR